MYSDKEHVDSVKWEIIWGHIHRESDLIFGFL